MGDVGIWETRAKPALYGFTPPEICVAEDLVLVVDLLTPVLRQGSHPNPQYPDSDSATGERIDMEGADPRSECDEGTRSQTRKRPTRSYSGLCHPLDLHLVMKYWPPVGYGKTHDDTVPGYIMGHNATSFKKSQAAAACRRLSAEVGNNIRGCNQGQNSGGSIMIHALFPALGRMADGRSDS